MCNCKAEIKINYHLDGRFDTMFCSVCGKVITLNAEQQARAEARFSKLAAEGKLKVVDVEGESGQ